jgi:hypothetical protein
LKIRPNTVGVKEEEVDVGNKTDTIDSNDEFAWFLPRIQFFCIRTREYMLGINYTYERESKVRQVFVKQMAQ